MWSLNNEVGQSYRQARKSSDKRKYMWYDPLFKGLQVCVYWQKKGKRCSFTIWLQFEGFHGLERGGKQKG